MRCDHPAPGQADNIGGAPPCGLGDSLCIPEAFRIGEESRLRDGDTAEGGLCGLAGLTLRGYELPVFCLEAGAGLLDTPFPCGCGEADRLRDGEEGFFP